MSLNYRMQCMQSTNVHCTTFSTTYFPLTACRLYVCTLFLAIRASQCQTNVRQKRKLFGHFGKQQQNLCTWLYSAVCSSFGFFCLACFLLGCLLQSQCTSMPNKRESCSVILANSSRQQLHVDSLDRFCNFCHSVFSNWFDIYYVSARLSSYTSTMKLKTPVLSACSSRFCKHTLQKVLPVQCSLCRSMSTVQIEP